MKQAIKKGEEIKEKLLLGLAISFKKLVQQKALTDGELIFSKEGKIIRIKARDLLNKAQ